MNNTSAYVSDYNDDEIRPAITMTKDNELFQSGFYKKDNTMHASGGIISTINDLTKWLQSNINHDDKLSENIWKEMHEPTTTQDRTYFTYKRNGYSLGWDIATYQNNSILTRFGGYAGISFHISFMPSKKIGIIAFSSDDRATYLTHLAANYAYNMINKSSDVENIYNNEKQLFDERFEKNSNRPLPLRDDRLLSNNDNDTLIGNYANNLGWPDITISKDDSTYNIKWGVLKGPIYNIPNPKQPYVGILGALNRTVNVRNDSLFTGSLKYEKQ
jgi:CubicO group peptidase (beta-lactamase class C family)